MKQIFKVAMYAISILAVSAQAGEFQSLTQRCEESLALSALPAALRDRANVYVWRDGDFEKTITSDGGFHCIVQRNHADSIIPECVSSTGEDSILQGIMVQTKMSAKGMSVDEVADAFQELIDNGDVRGPTQPGVNYMMSAYNRIYTSGSNSIARIGPHTMFFAPNATNEVVGGSFAMAREINGFPFVVEAGTHSYIIAFTSQSAETDQVVQHCSGQIDVTPVSAAVASN